MTVAIAYDERFLEHDHAGHPENAGRLRAIVQKLDETGQLARHPNIMPARPAGLDEVRLVHEPHLITEIQQITSRGGGWADADTYLNAGSWEIALLAAGAVVVATEKVVDGTHSSAFCLVRPPGHHATPGRAMGFCLLNNVAIAARAIQAGAGIERVAIVDFDVHHGNGTQDIFWSDPSVLYVSTHQYPYYPGTGHWTEAGGGKGSGSTLNLPLPPYCSDSEYARIYDEVVGPALQRFKPELILVSAGFDAHEQDPLAMESLTTAGYVALAGRIRDWAADLCAGRVVFALEGGYDYNALGECVSGILTVLDGGTWQDSPPAAGPDISELLDRIRTHHNLA